ncbi:hypothetical protein PRO82_000545 [Candidatus Protochlamydia amoebophila]|nr:hypothetical protein [Candidatus Protochlamydia amoebophila]
MYPQIFLMLGIHATKKLQLFTSINCKIKRYITNLIKDILRQPSSNSINYSETHIFVFKERFDQPKNDLKNNLMPYFQSYLQHAKKIFVVQKQAQA